MKNTSKLFKYSIAFLLVLLTAFTNSLGVVCNSARAAELDYSKYITYNKELYDSNRELCERIVDGMKNCTEMIYVGDFYVSDRTLMRYIIKTVLRKNPELFYVDPTKYMLGLDGEYIAVVCPFYLFDSQKIKESTAKFNAECDKYLEKIDDNMSDFEKAAILHDELILNCKYLDDDESTYVSAYESIVNKNANCQGYAMAYSYLLSRVGVYSEIVESSAMFHIWNKVRIDNKYYNVDLTWDDPMPDKAGNVQHKYFLLSDKAISSGDDEISGHYGFDYAYYSSTDTKFDNCLFREFNTKFCFAEGNCYVIDNEFHGKYERCLLNYDVDTDSAQIIKAFDFRWKSGPTSYWRGGYSSLDLFDGLIYFNSSDSTFSFDPVTNTMEEFIPVDVSSGNCYGLRIIDGAVYAVVGESPNVEGTLQFLGNCRSTVIPPAPIIGDVNLDGVINITDATMIQKYLVGQITFTDEQIRLADFNGDGRISVTDATDIQKRVVGLI